MRSNNIISSIANVIRFSVVGTSMLSSNALPNFGQRNFCYWPLSSRHCGADLLLGDLTLATAGITGNQMPAPSERPCQKQLVNLGLIQQLFLRLS